MAIWRRKLLRIPAKITSKNIKISAKRETVLGSKEVRLGNVV